MDLDFETEKPMTVVDAARKIVENYEVDTFECRYFQCFTSKVDDRNMHQTCLVGSPDLGVETGYVYFDVVAKGPQTRKEKYTSFEVSGGPGPIDEGELELAVARAMRSN
jgi:hypothetical protein